MLSPTGKVLVASQSIKDLAGWTPEELVGHGLDGLIHSDDLPSYRHSFEHCLNTGEPLTIYYRFKTKDDQYILFETTGHAHVASTEPAGNASAIGHGPGAAGGTKCFFGMARPYPSKNQAMLDSFLELKFENERLRQELQVMYKDIENTSAHTDFGEHPHATQALQTLRLSPIANSHPPPRSDWPPDGRNYSLGSTTDGSPVDTTTNGGAGSATVINPATGLIQSSTLLPSSSSTYGALGIGISSGSAKGGPDAEKKKKVSPIDRGARGVGGGAVLTRCDATGVGCRSLKWRRASLCAATAERWTHQSGARWVPSLSESDAPGRSRLTPLLLERFPLAGPGRPQVAVQRVRAALRQGALKGEQGRQGRQRGGQQVGFCISRPP